MSGKGFGERMGSWFRRVLSCCDDGEDEHERVALQISGPTNFRREDITIPGLDPEQQRFIREKAMLDAQLMYSHLQPLRSSPSGQFADPDHPTLPSYEEFTTPRTAPTPSPRHPSSRLDRVKAHSRKISDQFKTSFPGYQPMTMMREDSKHEIRALMHQQNAARKLSGDSDTPMGSELGEDRDSAWGASVRF